MRCGHRARLGVGEVSPAEFVVRRLRTVLFCPSSSTSRGPPLHSVPVHWGEGDGAQGGEGGGGDVEEEEARRRQRLARGLQMPGPRSTAQGTRDRRVSCWRRVGVHARVSQANEREVRAGEGVRDVREVQQLVGEGEELGEEREKSVGGGGGGAGAAGG